MSYTAEQALERAVRMARQSPCQKSKRGVVIWNPSLFDILCANHNHPPKGFSCDGSDECRANCGKHCVHAEMAAILDAKQGLHGFHMLHVKVVDGEAVPSGPPSCSECSKHILAAGIASMWLLHEEGLREYAADEFHELSLRERGLPVIR
jgi:deoxycytidylate deaminase